MLKIIPNMKACVEIGQWQNHTLHSLALKFEESAPFDRLPSQSHSHKFADWLKSLTDERKNENWCICIYRNCRSIAGKSQYMVHWACYAVWRSIMGSALLQPVWLRGFSLVVNKSSDSTTFLDETANWGPVCACMHSISSTEKMLTFMSLISEHEPKKYTQHYTILKDRTWLPPWLEKWSHMQKLIKNGEAQTSIREYRRRRRSFRTHGRY